MSNTKPSKSIQKGVNGFNTSYLEQYGEQRWKGLSKALKRPIRYALILNPFLNQSNKEIWLKDWCQQAINKTENKKLQYLQSTKKEIEDSNLIKDKLMKFYHKETNFNNEWELVLGPQPSLKTLKEGEELIMPFPTVLTCEEVNLSTHYLLDAASLLPVLALDLKSTDKVLDLCSAPGGKSLLIAFKLFNNNNNNNNNFNQFNNQAQLHCNEMNTIRYERLNKVLKQYLPNLLFNFNEQNSRLKVMNNDGTLYGLFGEHRYDKILIDAPCGSERHLIHNLNELKTYDRKMNLLNHQRQVKLLLSSLQLIKNQGRIVYSTCSINELENDKVIEEILKRFPNNLKVINLNFNLNNELECWGESTKFGWICLPDKSNGWGPIYIAALEYLDNQEMDIMDNNND